MSGTTIALPPGLTDAQVQAILAANKGIVFAAPAPPGAVVPLDVHRERILGWLDLLEGPLEAGESYLLPPPAGTILAGLTKEGLGLWRNKILNNPTKERWTNADMQAERDSLQPAKT